MDTTTEGSEELNASYVVAVEVVEPTYGAARVAIDLATGLSGCREVSVLRLRGPAWRGDMTNGGPVGQVTLENFSGALRGPFAKILRIRKFLKQESRTKKLVVITLLTTTNLYFYVAACGLPNVKLIATEHNIQTLALANYGSVKRVVLLRLMNTFYRFIDVIAVSNAVAEDLVSNVGVPRKKIKVVYNPIDVTRIVHEASESTPISVSTDFNIACVAELKAAKQHEVLLEVLTKLNGVQMYFIGGGTREVELREKAKLLGVASKVHFIGRLQNPWPLVSKMDATILTPKFEGFGLVAAESAAVGIRPIGLATGGLEEALDLAGGLKVKLGAGLVDRLADAIRDQMKRRQDDFSIPASWLETRTPRKVACEYIAVAEAT